MTISDPLVQHVLQQAMRRYESDCQIALSRLPYAKTLWEVKRAAQVHQPGILRGLHWPGQGAKHRLVHAAERRMAELLDAQLEKAAAIEDLKARKEFLGRLRMTEWDALRGDYAMLYRKADLQAHKLLA